MRQIGSIESEANAKKLAAYLLTLGIKSHIDFEDPVWDMWVRDEDQIEDAIAELEKFNANPDDPIYDNAEARAESIIEEKIQEVRKASQNVVEMRGKWKSPLQAKRRPLTIVLIVLCLMVAFFTGILPSGKSASSSMAYQALCFASSSDQVRVANTENHPTFLTQLNASFASIRKGEVWRAITPVFLHVNTVHIAFNLFFLYIIGSQIENEYGTWKYALLVLVFALIPNLAQAIAVGPNFAGISGVCYGLFGFAWIKSFLEPERGIYIGEFTVIIVLAWFVMGCFGLMNMNMANWAHGGGLFSGIFIAFWPHMVRAQNQQKK